GGWRTKDNKRRMSLPSTERPGGGGTGSCNRTGDSGTRSALSATSRSNALISNPLDGKRPFIVSPRCYGRRGPSHNTIREERFRVGQGGAEAAQAALCASAA